MAGPPIFRRVITRRTLIGLCAGGDMRPFWYNLADLSSVSLPLGLRSRVTVVAGLGWRDALPLLAPCVLLVMGALVGYPFSLDRAVARERLLGLVIITLVAAAAWVGLRRV